MKKDIFLNCGIFAVALSIGVVLAVGAGANTQGGGRTPQQVQTSIGQDVNKQHPNTGFTNITPTGASMQAPSARNPAKAWMSDDTETFRCISGFDVDRQMRNCTNCSFVCQNNVSERPVRPSGSSIECGADTFAVCAAHTDTIEFQGALIPADTRINTTDDGFVRSVPTVWEGQ